MDSCKAQCVARRQAVPDCGFATLEINPLILPGILWSVSANRIPGPF